MRTLKSLDLNRDREIYKKILNFQEQLNEGERKQSKGANISANIRRELACEKCSKTICKMFSRQNMQNQTNAKHSSNSEGIFKSTKKKLKKNLTPKRTPLTLPHLKF